MTLPPVYPNCPIILVRPSSHFLLLGYSSLYNYRDGIEENFYTEVSNLALLAFYGVAEFHVVGTHHFHFSKGYGPSEWQLLWSPTAVFVALGLADTQLPDLLARTISCLWISVLVKSGYRPLESACPSCWSMYCPSLDFIAGLALMCRMMFFIACGWSLSCFCSLSMSAIVSICVRVSCSTTCSWYPCGICLNK